MSSIASGTSKPEPLLPHAGELIGAFTRAFDLRLPDAMAKAAQRYFAGKGLTVENRVALHRAIASAIADDADLAREGSQEPLRVLLFAALEINSVAWNELVAVLGSKTADAEVLALAAPLFIQLGVIDLALRFGALHRLQGSDPVPTEDEVAWAFDEHAGVLLQRWRQRAELSVKALEETGAAPNTIQGWLHDGARPQPEYIAGLASILAPKLGQPVPDVRRLLTRHYGFSALSQPFRALLGKRFHEAVARFRYYATLTHEFLGHYPLTEEPSDGTSLTLLYGVAFRPAHAILDAIKRKVEQDRSWKAALSASIVDWIRWLVLGLTHASRIQTYVSSDGAAAMTREEQREYVLLCMTDLTDLDPSTFKTDDARACAGVLESQGEQFFALHNFELAARSFRRAVDLDPDNPSLHYRLGCALWGPLYTHGKEPASLASDVAEAERELWIAFRLAAKDGARWHLPAAWDRPLVELGELLMHSGRFEEALAHTKRLKEELGRHTALSACFVGSVHEHRGNLKEAARAYEESLRCDPHFESARQALERCRNAGSP